MFGDKKKNKWNKKKERDLCGGCDEDRGLFGGTGTGKGKKKKLG